MDRQYDFAALEALLKKRSFKALREALLELNEVDIAEFLGLLNGEEAVLAFRTLPKGMAADVFAELEPETQQLIVAAATDAELAVIVEDLYVDDAVDMLEDMPANVVKRILKNATPEMRGLINQFLKYPEHSAGVSFHEERENVERPGVLSARTRKKPKNGGTKRFSDA